jgi:hypothetical protein
VPSCASPLLSQSLTLCATLIKQRRHGVKQWVHCKGVVALLSAQVVRCGEGGLLVCAAALPGLALLLPLGRCSCCIVQVTVFICLVPILTIINCNSTTEQSSTSQQMGISHLVAAAGAASMSQSSSASYHHQL